MVYAYNLAACLLHDAGSFLVTKWLQNCQDGSGIFQLWNCQDGSAILHLQM